NKEAVASSIWLLFFLLECDSKLTHYHPNWLNFNSDNYPARGGFCREHHSSRNALAYKKATRRLVSAVYRYSNDKSEKCNLNDYKRGELTLTAELLYRWLALFSVQPRMAISRLNQMDKTEPDWTGYAKVILEFSKSYYPKARRFSR
ncbi:hypothetical protein QO226_22355, partial [Vibrio vulnificus]|nr:hypothetical protein [Vibrio vulnificus]